MKERVFITGGASGLGRALALRWAREGARVCIGDIHEARGKDTVAAIKDAGGEGLFLRCDVRHLEDFHAVAKRLQKDWGGVDVVINNAGIAAADAVEDALMEHWHQVLDINLLGVVRGCKVFTPIFKAQGHGAFVNVSSLAGIVHPPFMGTYNASKAAVVAFSETLSLELPPEKFSVSVVCPAFFKTNLEENLLSSTPRLTKITNRLFEKSKLSAEDVADMTYKGVKNKEFFIVTHPEGRFAFWMKRLTPPSFYLDEMRRRTKGMHRRS